MLCRTLSQHKKHYKIKTPEEKEDEVPYDMMAYSCMAIYFVFIVFISLFDICFEQQ